MTVPSRWELAAEAVVVKMRWVGVVIGYLLVNVEPHPAANAVMLNALLGLGALYALIDTWFSYRGRVFLGDFPLAIGALEAIFIGLLCYFDTGLESPFRYYYLLSLICAAIRHNRVVTYLTCGFHCLSCVLLFLSLPLEEQHLRSLVLMLVLLGWATWSANALAELLKRVGEHMHQLNQSLEEHRALLEERIAQRTRELEEAQARLLHQEKMAAFGLLAAGIAHEVGNPLTSISSLIQLLQRRIQDSYAQEKLALISGQLQRIQGILRELITFSRPAAKERVWTSPGEIVQEALNIAKYYKRLVGKTLRVQVGDSLPAVYVVRDQMVQAVLNLVLNAIDATERGGTIEVGATVRDGEVIVEVADNGQGIQDAGKLFRPYYTTKPHGTGLGLFVTRQLVTEHGGRVTFESEPGVRTVFRIHLPLR
ncbi:MAG: ATP-binding protein [Gemmatales bacterium]|nr:ATP-binding protein [Gemmatales bacterium]MDW8388209.1 ATP-binding protein [Gemmatales bacterium]